MESNIYITKIYDVIISDSAVIQPTEIEGEIQEDLIRICVNNNSENESIVSLEKFTHVFLVMELV